MAEVKKQTKQEHEKAVWVVVALVILVATFGAVFFKQIRDLVAPTPTVQDEDKVAFVIAQPNETFPRFSEVEFAPYAVETGGDITFRILVDDPDGISTVSAEIQGTGDMVDLKYQEAVGDIEVWEGTWSNARELTQDYNPVLFTSVSNSGATEAFTAFFKTDPGNINEQLAEQIITDNPTLTEEEKARIIESFGPVPVYDPLQPFTGKDGAPLTDEEVQELLESLRLDPNFTEEDIELIERDLTTPLDELPQADN